MRGLRWLISISLLFALSAAGATEFRGGETVGVSAGEVIEDDLYIGGTVVTIDGTVRGDVIASGRSVTVNGTVEGDLLAAGQSVTVNGEVGDDIRIAGAELQLGSGARIADDVMAAGYSLEAKTGSAVGGTLTFGGGQALLAGDITEDANLGVGGLELLGTVGGNVEAEVGTGTGAPRADAFPGMPDVPAVAPGLKLGDNARIGGDLNLTSSRGIAIDADAVSGEVTTEIRDVTVVTQTRSRLWKGFQRFIALAAVGFLLLWLAPRFLERSAEQLKMQPLTSLGLGALTLVGVPIALSVLLGLFILLIILLALISLGNLGGAVGVIGGALLLILGMLFALTLIYLTYVIVAYYGGRWILNRSDPNTEIKPVWALLLGIFVLVVVTSVPVLGPIAAFATLLFGLGALWRVRRGGSSSQEQLKQAPA